MMADILICSEKATFGQPEITLGIIPGGGGTQRLTSCIGKARTMDLVLANRKISGTEAAEWGLCARVVPAEQSVTEEAVKVAETIAKFGQVAAIAGKEAVNAGKYQATEKPKASRSRGSEERLPRGRRLPKSSRPACALPRWSSAATMASLFGEWAVIQRPSIALRDMELPSVAHASRAQEPLSSSA